jgi:hypothetical protein
MFKTDHLPVVNKGFTDKESYLTWRTAWRAHYAELTKAIRKHKAARKLPDAEARELAQCWCAVYRKEAAALLAQRKQSKIEAQRQYQSIFVYVGGVVSPTKKTEGAQNTALSK